jgi:hypothetical protein
VTGGVVTAGSVTAGTVTEGTVIGGGGSGGISAPADVAQPAISPPHVRTSWARRRRISNFISAELMPRRGGTCGVPPVERRG